MKKTYNEILEVLKEHFDNIHYFIDEDYIDYDKLNDDEDLDENELYLKNQKAHNDIKTLLGNCRVINVKKGDYDGSEWIKVYYFENHDVYLRITAYYTSYEGVQFEDSSWDSKELKEVRPKEVIKVIYE